MLSSQSGNQSRQNHKLKMLLIDRSWSLILNIIIERYLSDSTVCILEHNNYDWRLSQSAENYSSFVIINLDKLAGSFVDNVVDAKVKEQQLKLNELPYDDFLLKLTISIETSHCESFLVFGEHIPRFVAAFSQASMYSIWRSLYNKFVFALVATELDKFCCRDYFFEDQPNILFVVRNSENDSSFELKTNKYVGPRAQQPAQLQLLDIYDASERFSLNNCLFPDKLNDLQGREVIVAGFDYRPYTVIKQLEENTKSRSNARDVGRLDRPKVYIDGTETRVVLSFCEQFNCTVQIDTSDAYDWGTIYPNMTGDGAMGMIVQHKADVCIGAMYSWYDDYTYLDMSMYLVRSGITCLVPAPHRLASWYLPLQPFQGTLWAAVLLCLSIETVGLVLAHRSEVQLYNETQTEGSGSVWLSSWAFAAVTTFKLFISQSGNSNVRSVTVRVLLFACFLNDIIITSIYGGGLASILTIPSLGEAADTMQRMRSHRLQWAANSEAWVSAIRGSDDPLVQELLSNFHIYDDAQLLAMATTERMGFTVERLPFGHFAIADYLTGEAIDQLVIMQEDLYYQYTVAFVPRLWPLLGRFNDLIYRWHSSGFDKYWEYRVVADNLNVQLQQQVESTMPGVEGQDDINIEPVTLGMSNFAGILLVWVLGITGALIAFVTELLTYKFNRQSL